MENEVCEVSYFFDAEAKVYVAFCGGAMAEHRNLPGLRREILLAIQSLRDSDEPFRFVLVEKQD